MISNNQNYLKNILHKTCTKKLWKFSEALEDDDEEEEEKLFLRCLIQYK